MMGRLVTLTLALAAVQLCPVAAQTYPTRPITLVVPYVAGGGTDASARAVARRVSESLGQPVVIDNRPGAGTLIGGAYVAKSAPDGYTLLYGSVTHTIAPAISRQRATIDPVRDFTPITGIATFPLVIFVNAKLGVRSFSDLVARAKAEPGKLNYASVGFGTATHLAGETLKLATKTDIVHVPFNGSGPAVTALLSSQVEMAISDPPPALAFVQQGTFLALAVTSAKRSAALPDVPTIAEAAGLPDFDITSWWGIFGPAGLPPDITSRLSAAFSDALKQPDIREFMSKFAAEPVGSSPEEFGAFVKQQATTFSSLIKAANIEVP